MDEVDWGDGYIERARAKTGIEARFKLWPLTLGLLQEHRNPDAKGDGCVFITRKGGPLVWKRIGANGTRSRWTSGQVIPNVLGESHFALDSPVAGRVVGQFLGVSATLDAPPPRSPFSFWADPGASWRPR